MKKFCSLFLFIALMLGLGETGALAMDLNNAGAVSVTPLAPTQVSVRIDYAAGALSARHRLSLVVVGPNVPNGSMPSITKLRHLQDISQQDGLQLREIPIRLSAGGQYIIYVSATDTLTGEQQLWQKNYRVIDQAEVDRVCAAFQTATESDFVTLTQEVAEAEYILFDSAISLDDASLLRLAPWFIRAREAYDAGELSAERFAFATFDDVKNCIEAAYIFQLIDEEKPEAAAEIKRLGTDLSLLFADEAAVDRFFAIYSGTDKTIREDGYAAWRDSLELVMAFSLINGGTNREIAQVLSDNPTLFGLEPSKLAEAGISMQQLAGLVNNNLNKETDLTAAAAEIAALAQRLIRDAVKQTGTGGGGGTGSGAGKIVSVGSSNVTLPAAPGVADTTENQTVFSDLGGFDWAVDAIVRLQNRGIISGNEKGEFEPMRSVSRAEFVKMLVNTLGLATKDQKDPGFLDCPNQSWYYPFVEIAYNNGIVSGETTDWFGAATAVKRQDIAVMVQRALQMIKPLAAAEAEHAFSDDSAIADYAADAVYRAAGAGILTGYPDGDFQPEGLATRAEAAVIIGRVLTYLEGGAKA